MKEHWPRHVPVVKLDAAAVEALVLPFFPGNRILSIEPVKGGLINTNLKIRLSKRPGAVLLRLYQRGVAPAEKEMAVYRLVAGHVPVPHFIHFSPKSSIAGHPYALIDWIEGCELQAMFASLSAEKIVDLGYAIGRMLARIHAFHFDQFGFLDSNLKVAAPIDLDREGMLHYLKDCFIEGPGRERLGEKLTFALIEYASRRGDSLSQWPQPTLVHGDFNGSNILIRRPAGVWEIAAVIDWEYALSASPAFDFGNLLRPPLDNNPKFSASLARGYREGGGFLPQNWEAIARLADMFSFADILSRPATNTVVIEDAKAVIAKLLAS
ncbi:MAG TPA: aminoglycoside phosphotransferase family protein [Methylovirgula sp.]|nr:aminoglycoside phosphotransferase family protein [Methylovirgula sp.]